MKSLISFLEQELSKNGETIACLAIAASIGAVMLRSMESSSWIAPGLCLLLYIFMRKMYN